VKDPGVGRFALVLVLCAALAGCGRDDDQRAAGLVTERFLRAVEADEGQAACDQLSDDTAEALASDEGRPCAEAAPELEVEPSAVARAQVFGITAKVDLADGDSAFLELTPEGWRISAAGCRPEAGARPYECEVEA
jgi:hypothetical protein